MHKRLYNMRNLSKILATVWVVYTLNNIVLTSQPMKVNSVSTKNRSISYNALSSETRNNLSQPIKYVKKSVTMTTVINQKKYDNKSASNKVLPRQETLIYEHLFSYLHVPSVICVSNGAPSDPFLLIVVKSDVNHIGHRMAIRNTWGMTSKPGIKLVFVLGYSPLLKIFIQMESNLYKDIIQETFLDDYHNNTMKTIMAFTWVASHCNGAKYVFFVDDDYLVNIKYLWDHLQRLYDSGQRSTAIGYLWVNAKPQRNPASKWYVHKNEYPDETWPPYFTGGSMVLTTDIISKMATAFKFIKPIFIDDVYLGMVSKNLGITLTHESRFHPYYDPQRMAYLFTSHGVKSPKNLVEDWNKYHIKFDMVV